MDSREIWGVTTAYIFCTLARLFTLTMTFLPLLWIFGEYPRHAVYNPCKMWMDFSVSQSHTQEHARQNQCWLNKCMTNRCGNWDMICFQVHLSFYIERLIKQTQTGLQFQLNHRAERRSVEMFDSMTTNKTKVMTKRTEGPTEKMRLSVLRGILSFIRSYLTRLLKSKWVKKEKTEEKHRLMFWVQTHSFLLYGFTFK